MNNQFSLLDYVNDGVFVIDDDYRIVFWNKRLEIFSKLNFEELENKDLFECFPHLQKPYYKKRIDDILIGGSPAIFSSQIHKYIIPCPLADGNFRIQNTTVVAKKDDKNSNRFYAVFSIQDLTEEKQQIKMIREMRDTALAEIENRKEIEAKLRENNASKDKFFSIIGHDLKNPLHAIIGYTEMMMEDFDEIEKEELLAMLKSTYKISQNLAGLLQNLLDWARVQTDRMDYTPELFNVTNMIDSLVSLFELSAGKKHIKLNSGIKEQLIVYADQNMINTVFRNIISNAIKFTPKYGEVNISYLIEEDNIYFTIADTGVGMSKEMLEKLFKLEGSRTTRGTENEEGTGLGLILCKELIEKNEGNISVQSTPGIGTVFTVTLNRFKG